MWLVRGRTRPAGPGERAFVILLGLAAAGVVLGAAPLCPRCVAPSSANAAGPVCAADPVSAPGPVAASGPLAGFETLEDPADRTLPPAGAPRVFVPRSADRAARDEPRRRAVQEVLGAGWTLEPTSASSGSWVMRGPAVHLAEGTGFGALRALVARLPGLFEPGAADRLEPVFDRSRGASGVVRMRQVVGGARVAGGDVIAGFDPEGGLALLASSYRPRLDLLPGAAIAAGAAETIARTNLAAAHPEIVLLGAARAERWIWPLASEPGRVWIVRQATRHPWGSFTTRIDAATGEVLAREDGLQHKTRVGEGIVYRSNADYPNRTVSRKLMALHDGNADPAGHLDGEHVTVQDDKGSRVASETLRYLYYPFEEWDAFDQVALYYHLQLAHAHFQKTLGVRDLPWFDGPTPVAATANVRGLCDAFYSSDLSGDGAPGFVFGDQFSCESVLNEDFARDSDVVYHEYAHAIVDWMGIGLQDAPVNSYQRALSEADADYHAAEFTGDPRVGEVAGFPRSVDGAKSYPQDVGCSFGAPEEHCTGRIWSGLLWDLRSMVRGAEKLEFDSLDYLVDHPDVSPVPVWIDFWDATMALFDADAHENHGKNTGIIYGLATSRGIFGPRGYGNDQVGFLYEEMARGTRFKSIGWVRDGSEGGVPYYFRAPAGSTASIKVVSTSELHPDFLVGEALGYPLEYFAAASAKSATEATLLMELPAVDGLYVVTVRGADATNGSFQVSIVVKK